MSQNMWLSTSLLEHSTTKYFIEYDGFLSNHLAHGMIALARLGASENRVNRFINWYVERLENPVHPEHTEPPENPINIEKDEIIEYRGKRKAYYGILKYFEKQLQQSGSLDLLIKNEFGKLSKGMVCSAVHGLIHLGYGYSARIERLVLEGLAYIHHSYLPLKYDASKSGNSLAKFGQGSIDIVDVLKEVRHDQSLKSLLIQKPDDYMQGGFQFRVSQLMNEGDKLIEYANKIKLPPSLSAEQDQKRLVLKLSDWLIKQALFVYVTSEAVNDFFLIHGVTSAWSLHQMVPLLSVEDSLDAMRTYTCILLAVYLTQNCPELTRKIPENVAADESTWEKIIEETMAQDFDEHVFKLVQVAYEVWLDHKEDPKVSAVCVAAAETTIGNELTFAKYIGPNFS